MGLYYVSVKKEDRIGGHFLSVYILCKLIVMNPFSFFLLLLIVVPVVEIYFLIQVGGVIGAFSTIVLIVITAVLGAYLFRQQGLATFQRVQATIARGEIPALEMIEGLVLMVSGGLLLTPGFFTDIVGFIFSKKTFAHNGNDNNKAKFDCGAAWMSLTLQANMHQLHTHGIGGIDYANVYTTLNISPKDYDIICGFALGKINLPNTLSDELSAKESPSGRNPLDSVWQAGIR